MEASAPPYPVLMTRSVEIPREKSPKRVRVLYEYKAQHRDELSLEPGLNN
jgi:hypothetical protein